MDVAIVGASGAVGTGIPSAYSQRETSPLTTSTLRLTPFSRKLIQSKARDNEVKLLQHNDDFSGHQSGIPLSPEAGTSKEFADTEGLSTAA